MLAAMKLARATSVLLVGVVGLVAGCTPKAEGDWDGTIDFHSILGGVSLTGAPAHVHVAGDAITITGAPFTTCSPKLGKQNGRYARELASGVCKFTGEKSKEFAIPDSAGWMTFTGADTADFTFSSPTPPPDSGKADVSFTIRTHRVGK
jgi:hypothetical protein